MIPFPGDNVTCRVCKKELPVEDSVYCYWYGLRDDYCKPCWVRQAEKNMGRPVMANGEQKFMVRMVVEKEISVSGESPDDADRRAEELANAVAHNIRFTFGCEVDVEGIEEA